MNKGVIALLAAAALGALKNKEGSSASKPTTVWGYYGVRYKNPANVLAKLGRVLGYTDEQIERGIENPQNISLANLGAQLESLFRDELEYYERHNTPLMANLIHKVISSSSETNSTVSTFQNITYSVHGFIPIERNVSLLLSLDNKWYTGDGGFTTRNELFVSKASIITAAQKVLIRSFQSTYPEFRYLKRYLKSSQNGQVDGDFRGALKESIKKGNLTNIKRLMVSGRQTQIKRLSFISLPDEISSGIQNSANFGVIEEIRYDKQYQLNPLAFVLYTRVMLGCKGTVSLNALSRNPYSWAPGAVFTERGGLAFARVMMTPYNIDCQSGFVDPSILHWASTVLQKMELFDQKLMTGRGALSTFEQQNNTRLFASYTSDVVQSLMDIPLFNKCLADWKNNKKSITPKLLADLHLLCLGCVYKTVKHGVEDDSAIYMLGICDAYFNPLIPLGAASFESYKTCLENLIQGKGGSQYTISSTLIKDRPMSDCVGLSIDYLCYDVALETLKSFVVSDDILSQSQTLHPFFKYNYISPQNTFMEYRGLKGYQTILFSQDWVYVPDGNRSESEILSTSLAIRQQGFTKDGWKIYVSILNSNKATNTERVSMEVWGVYSGNELHFVSPISVDQLAYTPERLRKVGYWLSKVCVHLFRTLKSGQRSLALYLLSPIVSPRAIDIALDKYQGLIDPAILNSGLGEQAEQNSWFALLESRYYEGSIVFSKFKSTLKNILLKISSDSSSDISKLRKLHYEYKRSGGTQSQSWRELVNKITNIVDPANKQKFRNSLRDIGDGYYLNNLKQPVSFDAARKYIINVSSGDNPTKEEVETAQGQLNTQKLAKFEEQSNLILRSRGIQDGTPADIENIIKEGLKLERGLLNYLFEKNLNKPLIELLHLDSVQLIPNYLGGKIEGYQPSYLGRGFREPYIKAQIIKGNMSVPPNNLVAVWENGTEYFELSTRPSDPSTSNNRFERKLRVRLPNGSVLAKSIAEERRLMGVKPSVLSKIELEYAKNWESNEAKFYNKNLKIFNQVVTNVAQRLGYVDNGEPLSPKNVNAITLKQLLRAVGFNNTDEANNFDFNAIISNISSSKDVVEDQAISLFKLNPIPFVKGSSLAAYNEFLREYSTKTIGETEAGLVSLAVTLGIPLFPYIYIPTPAESNMLPSLGFNPVEYIVGKFEEENREKTVYNNYNNEYIPLIYQNDTFQEGLNKVSERSVSDTAYLQLEALQNDFNTFQKGIGLVSTSSFYTLLGMLVTTLKRQQLDAFGGPGGEVGFLPSYLKVREVDGGNLGILSDDPFGFSSMYQILAKHGKTLSTSAQQVIRRKTANPGKALKQAMKSSTLGAEQKDTISNLLKNRSFTRAVQLVNFDDSGVVREWGTIKNPITKELIKIIGPLSDHFSRVSQANTWARSANSFDQGKANAYWKKYDELATEVLMNADSLLSLMEINEIIHSKIPDLDLEKFSWAGLVENPTALQDFNMFLQEDIKGFIEIPGESSPDWAHDFRVALQQQAAKQQGLGLLRGQYKSRLDKIYDSYKEALESSVVYLEKERLGDLAFTTPEGYRVFTPTDPSHLHWASRASVTPSRITGVENQTDAHYVGRLPEDFLPTVSSSNTPLCIGWMGDSTGNIRNMMNGKRIHFVVLNPEGKLYMVSTFTISASGEWELQETQNEKNHSYLGTSYDGDEKIQRIKVGRSFLSGVRDWAAAPTSSGPKDLVENKKWDKAAKIYDWKGKALKFIGTDKQIYQGSPVSNNSYWTDLTSDIAAGIPYGNN